MKVLVVGGAGYIGSHMVRTLIHAKYEPLVFDDLSTGHREFVPKNVPFVKGDLKQLSDVKKVFGRYKIDAVMHFAASALVGESVENPLKYYENNVSACVNLLKVMVTHQVKYFIFSSTCATYGEPKKIPITEDHGQNPINPYGWSKLMIEKILADLSRTGQVRYVALRYFNACGAHPSAEIGERHDPEAHLIPNILKAVTGEKKELKIFGDDYDTPDGTCIRDYVHVSDLASAHLLALKALKKGMSSDVFNLSDGKGYSVREIVQAVERVTGRAVKHKICPRRPGDPSKLVGSVEKARKILGWKPVYDLEKINRNCLAMGKFTVKKNILVTGGAGYIGSHMVKVLTEEGFPCIVFDNLSTGVRRFVPKKAHFIQGDLRNLQDLRRVFKKYPIDTVMHFAASTVVPESVADPLKYYENNVLGSINLLKAMLERKVYRIIFSSTAAVYAEPKGDFVMENDNTDPANPYGRSKLMFEKILQDVSRASRLSYIIFRYFNACGADPSGELGSLRKEASLLLPNIIRAANGAPEVLTIYGDDYPTKDGTCIRDYVHVTDICQAHLAAYKALKGAGKKNNVFNLGTEKGYSVKEVIRATEEVTGRKVNFRIGPRRPGDLTCVVAGAQKARRVLGWKPEMDLKQIIATAWTWELHSTI